MAPSVPTFGVAKSIFHSWVVGLNQRRAISSMCPDGPSALYSARLARPSQTFLTTETPSISTHVVDPVSGCKRRDECVFQVPKSKSKSCCPFSTAPACSASVLAGDAEVLRIFGASACFSRVNSAMKAGAQVLPPSFEYDSSKWWESGAMLDHTARTRIDLSWKVSWAKSSPRPSWNAPTSGEVRAAILLLMNDWFH